MRPSANHSSFCCVMDEKSVTSQILPRAGKSAKLVIVKHLMMVILGRDNYFA